MWDLSLTAAELREDLHKASMDYIQGSADLSPLHADAASITPADAERALLDYLTDHSYTKAVAALSHWRWVDA